MRPILYCLMYFFASTAAAYAATPTSVTPTDKKETTQERTEKIVLESVPAPSFERIVEALRASKFKSADKMLDERIAFLKRAHLQEWTVRDGEPPLLQSMLLSFRLKIALAKYEAVKEHYEFITDNMKFPDAYALVMMIHRWTTEARKDPGAFKEKVGRFAELTWMFRQLQQP